MQNLFISENDEFKIQICVVNGKNGEIYCDTTKDALVKSVLEFMDISKYEFKDYEIVFRKPSFSDMTILYDQIFSMSVGNSISFNPLWARYKKFVLLIRQWNLTTDGSFKKPTEEEIKNLNPLIANIIGRELDQETGPLLS